jgi:hypothetical protein
VKRSLLLVLTAVAGLAASPQQSINWMRLDQAKGLAARTGNPILVFVACDPATGSSSCGNGPSDRAFGESCVEKRKDNFHFVRVVDKKMAQELKATRCAEIIFLDCDGDEFCRSSFQDVRTLDKAMEQALQKYSPKEIAWAAYDAKAGVTASEERKRLVVLGFSDEKKESSEALKVLEDRQLVKFHDRFLFLRVAFKKDSEECRKWGVTQAPTVVIVDPAKGDVVDRLSGRRSVKEIKPVFAKAMTRLEKPDKIDKK